MPKKKLRIERTPAALRWAGRERETKFKQAHPDVPYARTFGSPSEQDLLDAWGTSQAHTARAHIRNVKHAQAGLIQALREGLGQRKPVKPVSSKKVKRTTTRTRGPNPLP